MGSLGDTRIQLSKTQFVTYYHTDLAKAERFLLDFGFEVAAKSDDGKTIYYRGYGVEPYCYVSRLSTDSEPHWGGAAFLVPSRAELEKAAAVVEGTSAISKLDGPGGGEVVTLTDPVGHKVHLVWGIEERKAPVVPSNDSGMQKLVVNYADEKPRVGRGQRFKPGPAPIHKWGHYGVSYAPGTYQKMYDFYTGTLGLAVSDVVMVEGKPAVAFFHIDHGLSYTDHHSFYMKPAKENEKLDVAHSAFEVHDFDVQQLSHNYLESKGYKLSWGVGRHILGSQIFDYWYDESGFEVEHYADGDLVNSETEVTREELTPHSMYIWGPERPAVRG
jgi:catechol 2,3-dioxygenase-like lactoylglutathione lyase family enzyme